ncbi:plasmid maintenance protein [Borreliella bavariensis]|uniref:plasmid maintenance protein n=1 Tax=Borreliella bavariensis TaxID=664662 RepID=UPI00165DBE09|nr:plasmid maintenance protein [Borreliella bavariensis]
MHNLIKEINHINCRNKPYYPLIVLILTIEYMSTKMGASYYMGSTMLILFRENINKYSSISSIQKKINLAILHGYLDKLENEIQVITNKYKAQKNPLKLYYELKNYPIQTCVLKIIEHYELTNMA